MKRTTFSILMAASLTLLLGGAAEGQSTAGEAVTLRVLSYNIHRGVGGDERYDLARIARIIRDAKPDVVAMQEVDRGTQRSHGDDQPAKLAELTGMFPTYGKTIDYQGGEYGQLILTRHEPTSSRVHHLPGDAQREQRIALEVTTVKDGQSFRFVTSHLDYRAGSPDRLEQARAVSTAFDGADLPTVLAGDLNDTPGSETLAVFADGWLDASAGRDLPTYPAGQPTRQIDYVLLAPAARWSVEEVRVLEEPVASDHRPVLAIVELRGNSARAD